MPYVRMTSQMGTAHKHLPKHPGHHPEARTHPGNVKMRWPLLRETRDTVPEVTQQDFAAQHSGSVTRGTAGQDGHSVQTPQGPRPGVLQPFQNVLQEQRLARERETGAGGSILRKNSSYSRRISRISQNSTFPSLEKIAGKIKFTGEQRQLQAQNAVKQL